MAVASGLLLRQVDIPPGTGVGSGTAIGALGLLVAANVVATELSAARLPGLIAQYSVAKTSLHMAYSCVITMIVLVIARDIVTEHSTAVARAVPGLLLTLILIITAILSALIRRVGPGEAARAFLRARADAYRRAGQDVAKYQIDAEAARAAVHSMAHVELVASPSQTARRVAIASDKRGFVVPSVGRLENLRPRGDWAAGRLRLHMKNVLGRPVDPGEEIAAIVSSPDAVVPPSAIDAVKRAVTLAPSDRVDEFGEACAVLVKLAAQSAGSGDPRGAGRAADAFRLLLDSHMTGIADVRARRGGFDPSDEAPINPALLLIASTLTDEYLRAASPVNERTISNMLVSTLDSTPRERMAWIMSGVLLQKQHEGASESRVLTLARICADAAIEVDHRPAITTCSQVIERAAQSESVREGAIELAAYLCVRAVWRNYFRIRELWGRFTSLEPTDGHGSARAAACARIGAAGLLSGNVSIALSAAVHLNSNFDLDAVEKLIRVTGAFEQFLSDQHGHYLGIDAEAAEVKFLTFARAVAPIVGPQETERPSV